MNTPLSASAGLYELLLFAYPRQFRSKYGPEMASVFAQNCRQAYESSGYSAVFALWFETLHDLVCSALAEQVAMFFAGTKRDLLVVSRAPVFAAGAGALGGALLFIQAALVRSTLDHSHAKIPQFDSLVVAALSIALLWLAGGLVLFLLRQILGSTAVQAMPFAAGLGAFQHLAKLATMLASGAVLKYAMFDARLSLGALKFRAVSPQWVIFPVILMATVWAVILLRPFLTLRSLSPALPGCKWETGIGALELSTDHSSLKNL
jgi:hypothetical protein